MPLSPTPTPTPTLFVHEAGAHPAAAGAGPLPPAAAPRRPARAAWATLAAAVLLAACASPAGIAPGARMADATALGLQSAAADVPPLAPDWWHAFGDPVLDQLVDRALAGGPGLGLAQARVARAEALVSAAQAAEGPQVNGSADVTRQRFSATSIYPPPLGGSVRTLSTAQLAGSWEFDFFGRNRAALEAAVGTGRAAQADVQAARIVLAARVARAYVQLGRLQEQRAVAERALRQRDELLALVRQRVQGGLDTAVEQRQGEAALPETRQQIEALDEQIALARNALAALTAQPPAALAALVVPLARLQAPAVPAVLPADLLGRRPDVAAARWRVEAAGSDVQAARAQFYPNVSLTAFVGLSSIGLDRLLRAGSEQFGAGPALRLPIFDAGRLRAQLRARAADADAAVESYNDTVVEAVHEAADQIATLQSVARQQAEQQQAQAAAESAWDLAMQRYRAGLSTYLTVLNAEAAVLAQRRQASELRARALDARIGLMRALGGGWTPDA